MKCSFCSFNAVVIENRDLDSAYCAGHAIVYLKKMIDAVKLDKFDYEAVSDCLPEVKKEAVSVDCRQCANISIAQGTLFGFCNSAVVCVSGSRFVKLPAVQLYLAIGGVNYGE